MGDIRIESNCGQKIKVQKFDKDGNEIELDEQSYGFKEAKREGKGYVLNTKNRINIGAMDYSCGNKIVISSD